MAHEITVDGLDNVVAVRTLASGKQVVRSVLGIALSGNKAEKETLAFAVAEDAWFAKANIHPFVNELNRVFPTLAKTIEARNAMVNAEMAQNPGLTLKLINTRAPSKADVLAMFGIAHGLSGADKGGKLQLLAVGDHIRAIEIQRSIAKAERAAAFAAEQNAVAVI